MHFLLALSLLSTSGTAATTAIRPSTAIKTHGNNSTLSSKSSKATTHGTKKRTRQPSQMAGTLQLCSILHPRSPSFPSSCTKLPTAFARSKMIWVHLTPLPWTWARFQVMPQWSKVKFQVLTWPQPMEKSGVSRSISSAMLVVWIARTWEKSSTLSQNTSMDSPIHIQILQEAQLIA